MLTTGFFYLRRLSCWTAALLCAVSLAAQSVPVRDPRIASVLEELGKTRTFYQTAISPDGAKLAWVVTGVENGSRAGTEIAVAALAAPEKTIRITAGARGQFCTEDSIAWSPDSKTLAFLSDCESAGQADLYLADISRLAPGGKPEVRRLVHLHGVAEAPAFSPDGARLGFLYVEGATRRANPLAAEKPPAGVIGEEGLEIKRVAAISLGSDIFDPAGLNRPLGNRERKVLLPLFHFLTPAALYAYEFDWSPDSTGLAYIAAPPPGENNWWVAKLYTQHLTSDVPTTLLDPVTTPGQLHGLQIAVPRWSPDGKQIAFIGGLMSDQGATGGDLYLLSSSGGEARNITVGATTTIAWLRWLDNNRIGVAQVARGGCLFVELPAATVESAYNGPLNLSWLNLPATIEDGLLEGGLSLSSDNKTTAFIKSSFAEAPEVYAGPIDKPVQITRYNDNLKAAWGKSESVTWTSPVQPSPTIRAARVREADLGSSELKDFNVQGWLLYPANYDPTKKYPLIVYVHGGPSSATLPHWPSPGFGPAPFAALGYFVLMPNPRGSYGQGEAFTQANRKDFGYGDLRDILAGVDAVTKSHSIDPERVGLTGWSYGGFMTMFAVTQTNRFRAAVAGAGISNWQSYYGQNSIDQWMIPFLGASVYDDPGAYAKMSAVNFIKQVKTPTLAVVGDSDGECPAPQSFEFWHALRAQHVPTQLVVYPHEGHHFVDPEHQRDVLARALEWFQQYMPAN